MSIVRSLKTFNDPDEAATLVTSVYFPHDMHILGPKQDFGMQIKSTTLGPVTVGILSYGVDVRVDCSYPNSFTLNIPISGRIESLHDEQRLIATRGQGTLFSADRSATVTLWTADCVGIGLKVDQEYMRDKLLLLSGTDEEIRLPDQVDLSTPNWRGWVNLLHALASQPPRDGDLLQSELVTKQLSGAITDSLITGLLGNEHKNHDNSPARPRQVKRVVDAFHANPAHAWTLSEMVTIAEVSARRLQQSFKEFIGVTPTEYLRDLRLSLVHRDLLNDVGQVTIHEIAARWGFTHPGRFSLYYKEKYGYLPSQSQRSG